MATDIAESPVTDADRWAVETERQVTDDERFALIISLTGATHFRGGVRDQRSQLFGLGGGARPAVEVL